MGRKKLKEIPLDPQPSKYCWRVHVCRDAKRKLHVGGITDFYGAYEWMSAESWEEIAVVECHQPFVHDQDQILFSQMSGVNAQPWTASQILAAAQHQMFGFTIVRQEATSGT